MPGAVVVVDVDEQHVGQQHRQGEEPEAAGHDHRPGEQRDPAHPEAGVRMAMMVVITQIEADADGEAMTNASAMKLRSTALARPPPGPPLMA